MVRSSFQIGWPPPARSMMLSRRMPSARPYLGFTYFPSPSGPRCAMRPSIRPSRSGSSCPDPELPERLGRMLGLIAHRGPDGEGKYVNPKYGLALGMRRLSIIDLAGGGQPIWNEDRTIGVVFNGEIYNYVELQAELEARG